MESQDNTMFYRLYATWYEKLKSPVSSGMRIEAVNVRRMDRRHKFYHCNGKGLKNITFGGFPVAKQGRVKRDIVD